MPTNQNVYNSRVTSEALEKRFRDTFKSQGGAELVDDLYAQGVIVPVVDFTAAATDETLAQNLQTAWDFSTGSAQVFNTTQTLISNAGFWLVDAIYSNGGSPSSSGIVQINDGTTTKPVGGAFFPGAAPGSIVEQKFVVFLRSGDSLEAVSTQSTCIIDIWYRQIATVNGDLINPTGFTSS